MANPFDQFDQATATKPANTVANPFDQYDQSEPHEPTWYDQAKTYAKDIVKSAPGSLARASSGLMGLGEAVINKLGPLGDIKESDIKPDSTIGKYVAKMTPEEKKRFFMSVGDTSLSGLKQIMGPVYQDPQTTPGKVADFALQNVLFGAKNPKELLNAPKTLRNLISGTTAGAAGELVPDDMPKVKMAAQLVGGFSPSLVETALKSPDRTTRNAAAMLKQAMAGKSDVEWKQADELFQKSKQVGVPLSGPEAFKGGSQVQQLASDVAASPVAGAKIRAFTQPRADLVQASVAQHLKQLGVDIGGQEAANQVQSAADKVITNSQEFRTKAASPDYKYQRSSDAEALSLMDQIQKQKVDIKNGTAWKNDAIQQAGKWYQFSHEMGLKANDVAKKIKEWSAQDAKGISNFENEGGRVEKNPGSQEMVGRYMKRREEGKTATYDAVKTARDRQNYIDQWRNDMEKNADTLAAKNLPAIQGKVQSFVSSLDSDIRLAGPAERDVLLKYRNEIAPDGKPLMLPSQLESVYKSNRNKLDLGLNPTDEQKTAAGVLKGHVKSLDSLIQDVSPAIKQGREIYAQISKEMVDPLFKGPIGKLAGKGADAQMEASYPRMISELNGKTANPARIAEIADKLKTVDKEAFPNMTRVYLEEQINTAMKDLQGRRNPSAGANFRNAIEGTPRDRENLQTMIEKTAEAQGQNPKKVYAGFRNLLDVLDATGRVPGMGSQTQSRMENAAMARSNPVSGAIEAVSSTPTKRISKWLDDMMYKKTYSKLADVFTSQESVKEMQKLANLKPTSTEARGIVATMLTSAAQGANNDQSQKDKADGGRNDQ